MPNQNNFRSDVTTTTVPRYTASRIVRFPEEGVLVEEIPASFAYDAEDNIEVHFYTIPANVLLTSLVIKPTDNVIKSHIVSFADGTYKNYIQIDFTKLFVDKNQIVIPGDYRMVLNFFSDEIGSYNNRTLSIIDVSPSGTELELVFNNTIDDVSAVENARLLKEFVVRSFAKPDAIGIVEKIFKSGLELNDPTEGITADTIIENIEVPRLNQTYRNTIRRIERLGLLPEFKTQLNIFLSKLFESIREEIIINGDERIQEDELIPIFRKVAQNNIESLQTSLDQRIIVK